MNSIPAVEMNQLTVELNQGKQHQRILDQVSFRVEEGKTVGFIGPNGAGKTTALHVLLGFMAPTTGRAMIFGEDSQTPEARAKIGYLSEHPEAYRFLTAWEYLDLIGKLFSIPASLRKKRIEQLLNDVELQDHAHKRIALYSRGMLQRIGLAQALINDPDLLILDEPTNGLDPLGRMHIRNLIERLKGEGKTIFFSSHELSAIETVCDEIIMIHQGKILKQGSLSDFMNKEHSLEETFLSLLKTSTEA